MIAPPPASPPRPRLLSDPDDPRLVDVLDRLLDRGVALRGDLMISVAGVDLVYVGLQAVIASPDALQRPAEAGDGDPAR